MNSDFSLALHALVLLHRRGGVQSSEAMAQNICTNPVRVRRVLAKLKRPAGCRRARAARAATAWLPTRIR